MRSGVRLARYARMNRSALLCLGMLVFAGRSDAAVFGRNRMHLLSPGMKQKLTAKARANVARTVSIGGGSGVLVSVRGNRALLLTNQHVVEGAVGALPVRFYSGDRQLVATRSTRVLSMSESLDYALVEIDLHGVDRALVGEPARLRTTPVKKGEKLYKVGFPGLSLLATPAYGRFDWTEQDRRNDYARQPTRKVISVGHEIGGGEVRVFQDPDPRPGHRAVVPRHSIAIDDSSLPGNSGSPVFSADTHEVVALHWAGGTSHKAGDPELADRWSTANYAVPMSLVLADVRANVAAGRIAKDVAADVRKLASVR